MFTFMRGYVYIVTNKRNGTLYTGVTSDLRRRLDEHRRGAGGKFTRAYNLRRLVWFEEHDLVADAIWREKRVKKYERAWKINLIEATNPEWRDLSDHLMTLDW